MPEPVLQASRNAAESAARESFGRLVSWLAWQWRDVAAAEDALSDALLKALEVWPVQGVPRVPEAWLLAVAKRELLQVARHDRVRLDPALTVLFENEAAEEMPPDIPDARLKLMFVCAHPAIDEQIRTPLMLQVVLGLQADQIAQAMLMSPSALAQRLVRAKQKIRDTALRFEEPEISELPKRLHHVLEAIYGAFGLEVDVIEGAESRVTDLRQEALFLGSVVCQLMPHSAEAKGLLALMLMSQSRRGVAPRVRVMRHSFRLISRMFNAGIAKPLFRLTNCCGLPPGCGSQGRFRWKRPFNRHIVSVCFQASPRGTQLPIYTAR